MLIVEVNGTELNDIYSLTIEYNLRRCVNTLEIRLSFEEKDKDIFSPFLYPEIEIKYHNKIIFKGIIENIGKTLRSREIALEARSKTSVLVDTSCIEKYTYQKTTLVRLCKQVCSNYNIDVINPNGDSETFNTIQMNIGQNIFSQLNEVASMSLIENTTPLLASDFEGRLVVGKNIYDSDVIIDLSEKDENLTDCKSLFNGSKRHSEYKRFAQSSGNINIKSSTLHDKNISTNVPSYASCNGGSMAQCSNYSVKDRALDISDSYQLEVALSTWLDKNNNTIETGKLISLHSPNSMIFDKTNFLIEKVTLSFNNTGYHSILKLTDKDTYKK